MSGTTLTRLPRFGLQELTTRTITASGNVLDSDEALFVNANAADIVVTIPTALRVDGARLFVKRIDNNANKFAYVTGGDIGGDDTHIVLAPTTGHGQKSGEGVELIYSSAAARWEVLGSNANTELADYEKFLVLGGTRSFNAATNQINWDGRWLSIGNGYSPGNAEDQFINLTEPPVGTLFRIDAGPATRAWTATGLVLNDWETLSYEYEPNSGTTTDHTRWRIRTYNSNFQRSETEIVLAQKVGDTRDAVKWHDGVWSESSVQTADFWRTSVGATLPDGTADTTEDVSRTGRVGIGVTTPLSQLDIAQGARTGTGNMSADAAFLVTGNLPSIDGLTACTPPITHVAAFKHSNQTQGIGFGYDGLYTTGSNASQNFVMAQRGSGYHLKKWQSVNQPQDIRANCFPMAINTGYMERDFTAGVEVARTYKGFTENATGTETRNLWMLQHSGLRNAMRLQPSPRNTTGFSLAVGENDLGRDKLILYNVDNTNQWQAMSLGVESNDSGAMTYQTYSTWAHRFYNSDNATALGSRLLMEVQSNGNVGIGTQTNGTRYNSAQARLDVRTNAVIGPVTTMANRPSAILANGLTVFSNTPASATVDAPEAVLRLVREQVGGVAWGRTAEFRVGTHAAGINASSRLEIWLGSGASWTPNVRVFRADSNGVVNLANCPVYATNAIALAAGRVVGDIYRTLAGDLKIVI